MKDERIFGLIGFSLKHSFSRTYFLDKFEKEHLLNCQYLNFELDSVDGIYDLTSRYENLVGLNVTIPYKKAIIGYLDKIYPLAIRAGAVNCVKLVQGKLHGFNTDVTGVQQTIESWIHETNNLKALVLGTGGAAGAVCRALELLNIPFQAVSRRSGNETVTYQELDQNWLEEYRLIINTTPLGMYPETDQCPNIPYQFLTANHFLFDLIYNPSKTLFLEKGEAAGAHTINGQKMLIAQAEASWNIWNNSSDVDNE